MTSPRQSKNITTSGGSNKQVNIITGTQKNMDKQHILIIGDGGVGKTSYIKKQLGQNFTHQYHPTTGINIYETDTIVWYDFPGQEKYGSHFINNDIHLVIYMYDLSNKLSYKNLDYWKKYVNTNYGDIGSFKIGNKSDLNVNNIGTSDILNTNRY